MAKNRYTLDELKMRGDFIRRHIGPGEPQIGEMLEALGLASLDELIDKAVPKDIVLDQPLALDEPTSERMTLSTLRQMAGRNRVFISMMGMGYYGTVTPTVILRNVVENPGWYTAYTPYQPEVSQGRLEALLAFQQMVMDLTGMELANASLLDEATAAAEAMALAKRVSKSKSMTFFVDRDCHPQTLAVVRTRARHFDFEVIEGDPYGDELTQSDVFGVLIQYPGSTGRLRDISEVVERVHEKQALAVVAADLLSLCLLKPPGEMGADVVIGSAQPAGAAYGAPDPRAAHPPREGDQQYLHRTGAPGRGGGIVRRLPRTGWAKADRRPCSSHGLDCRRGPAPCGLQCGGRCVLRHVARTRARSGRPAGRQCARIAN
jgi:glycine dehydrogenase